MAGTSKRNRSNAFVAEVARFLEVEPADVESMIRTARLPALRVQKPTRSVTRIPLRSFHAWLMGRTENPGPMADYPVFLEEFRRAGDRS